MQLLISLASGRSGLKDAIPLMSAKVGFLAHYQPLGTKATTHIPRDIADDLVTRMIAERITQKVIRAFPPNTPFQRLNVGGSTRYIPDRLPPAELECTRFQLPQTENWKEEHMPATRSLQTRAFMAMRVLQSELRG